MWDKLNKLMLSLPNEIIERYEIKVDSEKVFYVVNEKHCYIEKKEAIKSFDSSLKFSEEYVLKNSNKYEVIIRRNSFNPLSSKRFNKDYEFKDNDNGITYKIGYSSLQYAIEYYAYNLQKRGLGNYRERIYEEDKSEINSFQHFFDSLFGKIKTVSIVSKTEKSSDFMMATGNSFLFNLAYKTGVVYRPVLNTRIDREILRLTRSKRKTSIDDIQIPRRHYREELLEQYYMALSSGEPFIEFICYYHIMEHFFIEVFNNDLIEQIKYQIGRPSFTLKTSKSIVKIIDIIEKSLKNANTESKTNEIYALELTLKKYIPSLEDLKDDLNNYNSNLVDYYKNNKVEFSDGIEIDFNTELSDKIYKKLASRIYSTRNAIIHSKSFETKQKEKNSYKPFKDENSLRKEIPLMQIIAENIIINTSDEMN